jgi:hypothetical protein
MTMNYQHVQPFSRRTAEIAFASGNIKNVCEALVSVALHDCDWRWAQDTCLNFLNSESLEVRGIAATCLGHIARIHRQLDKEKVLAALRKHLNEEAMAGRIEDAMDDIGMFFE